jgi:hypothetical protein
MEPSKTAVPKSKTVAAAGILLAVVLAHLLRAGSHLRGTPARLYSSYFSDVAIPVGAYFVLLLVRDPRFAFLKDWRRRAVLVFGMASFAEVLQAFGAPLLGRTFDPVDFAMYAIGVSLAVFIEKAMLDRLPRRTPSPCSEV